MTGRLPVLEDLPALAGRSVLVRVDFNVPIGVDGERRIVADDFRIRAALPTLRWLMEHGASVVCATHLGRPKGAPDPRFDVAPVRARLAELLPGVELLENLRFDPGEEANDPAFVDRLVAGHDCYVNDAFGASHRAHASIVGPPARLPSAAGRLLAREVEIIGGLLDAPEHPFVAVIGGAKVADKLGVLRSLVAKADTVLVGGGMSYTFLAAQGRRIGASLCDPSQIEACRDLLASPGTIELPTDVVAIGPGGTLHPGEKSVAEGDPIAVYSGDLPDGWEGVDIGDETRGRFAAAIEGAGTVFWNGPVGLFEDPRFAAGTRALAAAVAACPGFTVVGGGDSAAAIDEFGLAGSIDFISTGGGASLELLELGDLPGLAALRGAANAPQGS
ncbi:MAG TPA: phosphoglycerate kinase [Acidimicrobiales bacterium]|nr:phosphoglycerate kinase [Acidimicrobiales bacterium]